MSENQGSLWTDSGRTITEAQLVDISWVARRLGVTERHVRRLVAERRIPFIKGPSPALRPRQIEAWIDSGHRSASGER